MKLTVAHDVLADAVAWAARTLPQRPSVPALAGILVEADADTGLTLSVFDYEVSARANVPADVAEPGRILLPGRVLAEIVKSLPNRDIEIVLSGAEVTLTCGAAEFTLLTLPVSDYPSLPEPPAPVGTMDPAVFREAIAQVFPAASSDDALPMLTGIRVDIDGPAVSMAATDRYRIAARTLTWQPTDPDVQHGQVVPGNALHDIAKGLPAGAAAIGLNDKLFGVSGGGRATTVRLLDDQFIDYSARLGDDYPIHAEVDVALMIAAVKRVALMAERNTAVRLDFSGDELTVRAGGGDTGRGTETIPCRVDGKDVETAFQPSFLLEALTAVAADAATVRIGMTAPAKPCLFTPAADDASFRCLVMAIRLA